MNKFNSSLASVKYLITTRKSKNEERIRQAEYEFAKDVVGEEVLARDLDVRLMAYPKYGYMTPFAATEAFARELQGAIAVFASNVGAKAPGSGKYNPLFASPVMLKGTWEARQIVDELCIPYDFYSWHSVMYWSEQGNTRIPRPSQLCAPDVIAHVMELWADPYYRNHYQLFGACWDPRFGADHYTGATQQLAYLGLIDQRLADARILGLDPAQALGPLLGHAISRDNAVRRYGQELVDRAVEIQATSEAEIAAIVAGISHSAGTVEASKHV